MRFNKKFSFLSKLNFKKKSKKSFDFYCITHPLIPDDLPLSSLPQAKLLDILSSNPPLYYCTSVDQAAIYCDRFIFLKAYPQFKQWCEFHGKSITDDETWVDFRNNFLYAYKIPGIDLDVYRLNYNHEQLANILRLSCLCLALDLPWEAPQEMPASVSLVSKSPEFKQVLGNLKDFYHDIGIPQEDFPRDLEMLEH